MKHNLFDSLDHNFDASDDSPDGSKHFWLIDAKHHEKNSHHSTECDEYSLSKASIHRMDGDIAAVVDFFHKKKCWCQKTRCHKKACHSHKEKCNISTFCWDRVHIKKQQKYRSSTHAKDEKQDEKIWLQRHQYLTKNNTWSRLAVDYAVWIYFQVILYETFSKRK